MKTTNTTSDGLALRLRTRHVVLAFAALLLLPVPASAAPVEAKRHMVVAAHPLAAEAGREILRAGGNAIDAAIATELVLTLVEPQSSGIGGGAFLVYFDRAKNRVVTYDGRETAPAAAKSDLFLRPDGTPMDFMEAVVGGRSVGVPGFLRMADMAHQAHGRLPWKSLFAPAIRLAENGFPLSPRLAQQIAEDRHLDTFEATRRYFYTDDGAPREAGSVLANPELAATLRAIAEEGADTFYDGPIAADIARTVREASLNPGQMTEADIAVYRARERPPLCAPYRVWRVCGMGPPTSGGLAVLETLGILQSFDLETLPPHSVAALHLVGEAMKLAYADRDAYTGDPDFVDVPIKALLDPRYLARRAKLISPERAMSRAEPGRLDEASATPARTGTGESGFSTTHLSVVDAEGNAVAMTASIEMAFGSRLMARGFLLNNELTDFAFVPDDNGVPKANRVEGGKRPRSTMSPTLVFDSEGRLRYVIGSPGGPFIAPYVIKTLIAVLDWGLDIEAAIALPNFANRNGPFELEEGTTLADVVPGLEALGHEVKFRPMQSGLHGIAVSDGGLEGAADPRGEGVALGD